MRISTYLSLCAIASVFIGVVRILPAQTPVSRIHSEITNAASSPLKASKPLMAEVQYDAGRLPADTRLEGIILVFNRSAAQESAVKALIAAQQDPSSPAYHRWLTPEQFAARFGLSDSDLTKAQNWLQEQGFAIDSVARSKNAIRFTGTARQVEQAFSTEMHIFQNGPHGVGLAPTDATLSIWGQLLANWLRDRGLLR